MTDDDLRAQLRAAHADDAAPAFEETLMAARARRPARRVVPVLAGALALALAAALAVLLFVRRPTKPLPATDIGMNTTTLHMPLDSLLDVPDQSLLSTTPDLTRGAVP